MSFMPGDLVVCVDASMRGYAPPRGYYWAGDLPDGLYKGAVYTIRECGRIDPLLPGEDSVRLVEIVRTAQPYTGEEAALRARRFRPVSKTNTEIVASLLTPNKEEERV